VEEEGRGWFLEEFWIKGHRKEERETEEREERRKQ
jgi:hypothetical protein